MWRRIMLFSILPSFILGYWIWQDFSPRGQAIFVKNGSSMTKNISQYYPEGRLGEPIYINNVEYQNVLSEPIYFDVRIPRVMDEIEVKMAIVGDAEGVKIGLRQPPMINQEWRYKIEKPTTVVNAEDRIITHAFKLSESYVEKGKVRFIMSVPAGQEIYLGGLEVIVSGDSLTVSDVVHSIQSRLRL